MWRSVTVLGLFVVVGCGAWLNMSTTSSFITGQVTGNNGPEAGVWVIAETKELKTGYTKIVVTDDEGRFLLPEMPSANYDIWVRGYGLKDSVKVKSKPGDTLRLKAAYPVNAQEAAQIYPANYWYSLVEPPGHHEFPGTGSAGNGIRKNRPTQEAWIDAMKQECQLCHQLGTKQTREISHLIEGSENTATKSTIDAWGRLSEKFADTKEAWSHRLSFSGGLMEYYTVNIGRARLVDMYADWTDRIRAGETPPPPPRPAGIERNLVITLWDWGEAGTFVHDEVTTDKRDPHVNAKGPLYGVGQLSSELLITDPEKHTSTRLIVPTSVSGSSGVQPNKSETADGKHASRGADNHNPMMDQKGRVWMTSRVENKDAVPVWCREDSQHPSAKYFPLHGSSRHASYYDPASQKFELIHTCYTTHHLQFANDEANTLWFSGDNQVVGWINTKKLDETGDKQSSQGWCPTVLDTNGDGKITKPWNEPGEKAKPDLDTRIGGPNNGLTRYSVGVPGFAYGVIPNPKDGSVWVTRPWPTPGQIIRVDPGSNPPETCKAEVYQPPFNTDSIPRKDWGYAPRGIDIDTDGVIWTALSGSGHMASFDRRKCKVINGPTATGQHCREGWTLYPAPGPKMKGVQSAGGADYHYYNWVDQFNVLGLGKNTPIATGTSSDSLLALDPDTGKWVVMRVPYPMGFYSRGLDGRIDDPKAGWKGSAIYANYGGFPLWHMEGGKAAKGKVVKFQIRPDPLAE